MDDIDQRLWNANMCAPPAPNIVVNQVIDERSEQEALDIHICIPRKKPSAEQIINVYVKKLRITHVHLITDKVIVRGDFEVKAIYVGCMPSQPVHAVEIKCVRFAIDLPMWGARCGMETDASVIVEYIDFDEGRDHRDSNERYKNKYGNLKKQHYTCGHDYDDCHDECDDDYGHHHHDDCDDECHEDHGHHHQDDCHEDYEHHHKSGCCHKCCREFDVSVVLRVNAKVMVGRKIMINPVYPKMPVHHQMSAYPKMPNHPKG